MRRLDIRWLIVLLANLLLCWMVGTANHYLSRFSFLWMDYCSIHLYIGGLFVLYAALRLDSKHGWIAVLLTGLMTDSLDPVPFGSSMLLLGLVYATLLYGRRRFPREGSIFGIVVALFANLFLVIALSFLLVGANPRPGEIWLRIFVDLLASQAVIILITPWFLALQERAMAMIRTHPETGRRVAF
jgi:cell shape-determining protein MreD